MKIKYDFLSPIKRSKNRQNRKNSQDSDDNNDTLEDFLDKDFTTSRKKSRVFHLVVITILVLTMTSLAGFSYWQWNNQQNRNNKIPQVAGIRETGVKNVVSGDNFSFVLDQKTPDNFAMTRNSIQSPFFDQKSVINSTFAQKTTTSSGENAAGIQIISSEYDSKLDQKTFAKKIKETLGEDWEILSEDINLPGQVLVSKIQKKDKSQTYYTTATRNYYYVIMMMIPSKNTPEYERINNFVENLLPNLNLN